jgi:putative membrane protein
MENGLDEVRHAGTRVRHMKPVPTLGRWRAVCLAVGLLLAWIAVASPISWCESQSLTGHMVGHLLLMSLAPPLIWLGEPIRLLFSGAAPPIRMWPIRKIGAPIGHPAVCWLAATCALVGWHVPAALALGMQSATWHAIQQASFLTAGLFFWWPVVRPWPAVSTQPEWSMVVYLFLATLPCDILSGFLVFSERVAYPVYLSHGHSAASILNDQQYAGALMWTVVTIVYLVAGVIVTTRLLSASVVRLTNPRASEFV